MQGVAQLVSAPIEQVRRRIRGHRVLIAASLAVIIAAATAYAGAAPGEILPVVFAFSAVVVAGTMTSFFGLPSDLTVARRLDRRLRLSERLSTAVELLATDRPSGSVARLQMQDAARMASRVDVRKVAPVVSPLVAALAVLALGCVGLAVGLPQEPLLPTGPETTTGTLAVADGEDIAKLAELVAQDAESRDDRYLAAIAKALSELAGMTLAEPERGERLAELVEQARGIYGDQLPAWFPSSDGPPGPLRGAGAVDAETTRRAAADSTETMSAREMYSADAGQEARAAAADAAAADAAARAAEDADLPKPGGPSEPRLMEDQPLQSIGLRPAGAAADSGKDGGNAAGLGSQPLAGDPDQGASEPGSREDVVLAADDKEAGAGLLERVAPRVNLVAVDGSVADTGDDWARQRAETVSREPVGAAAAAVVSRYFTPQSP